jgi:hypothetical protein
MWLYSVGKHSIFQVITSQYKEGGKKLQSLHAFGTITEMNSRCVMSCFTHGGIRTCSCVYVGLRDHTGWTGSGANNSNELMEDDNVDIYDSGRIWNIMYIPITFK